MCVRVGERRKLRLAVALAEYDGGWRAVPLIYSLSPAWGKEERTLDMIFFSAASTTPSFDNTPTAAPAWLMASMAYSTCHHIARAWDG